VGGSSSSSSSSSSANPGQALNLNIPSFGDADNAGAFGMGATRPGFGAGGNPQDGDGGDGGYDG